MQADPLEGAYKIEKRAGGRVVLIGGPYLSVNVKIDPPLRLDELEVEVLRSERTNHGRVVNTVVTARASLPAWLEDALFEPFRGKALVRGPYGQEVRVGEVYSHEVREHPVNYRGCRTDKDKSKRLLKVRKEAEAFDSAPLEQKVRRSMLEYLEGIIEGHRAEFKRTHMRLFTECDYVYVYVPVDPE